MSTKVLNPVKKPKAINLLCSCRPAKSTSFRKGLSRDRRELILATNKKWVNGTVLKYYFFTSRALGGSSIEKNQVRKAFKEWKGIGIGLEFEEVSSKAESVIRIGFKNGDGSWSYIGRDNWDISKRNRTMNFGWDVTTSYGYDTVLHEIGHALGFPHEHQNPFAGIIWNRANVINDLKLPPNEWTVQQIEDNVLRPMQTDESKGSDLDKNSIMMYELDDSWIDGPPPLNRDGIHPDSGLSVIDKTWAKKFYPTVGSTPLPALKLYVTSTFKILPREQISYSFIPKVTREYTIRTFGKIDSIMVLFELTSSGEKYVSGDDDSSEDRNSSITKSLTKGKEYIIRTRLYSHWGEEAMSIIIF